MRLIGFGFGAKLMWIAVWAHFLVSAFWWAVLMFVIDLKKMREEVVRKVAIVLARIAEHFVSAVARSVNCISDRPTGNRLTWLVVVWRQRLQCFDNLHMCMLDHMPDERKNIHSIPSGSCFSCNCSLCCWLCA